MLIEKNQSRRKDIHAKLGKFGITVLFSTFSVLLSLVLGYGITYFLGTELTKTELAMTIVIPAIIAPIMSWYSLNNYYKIEKLERQMRTLATYDSLTGLLRREAFLDMAENLYQKTISDKEGIAILYIDIDDFKSINDNYGHKKGDEVLSRFGQIIRSTIGVDDVAGRIGGEEVVVFFKDVDHAKIVYIVGRIQGAIAKSGIAVDGEILHYSVSMGAVLYMGNGMALDNLVASADKALYKAKHSGKDCAYLYIDEGIFELLEAKSRQQNGLSV